MIREPKNMYVEESNEIRIKIEKNMSSFNNNIKNEDFFTMVSGMCIYKSNEIEDKNSYLRYTLQMISSLRNKKDLEEFDVFKHTNYLEKRSLLQHYCVIKEIFEKKDQSLTVDNIIEWASMLMKNIISIPITYRTYEVFEGQKVFISHSLIKESMEKLVEKYNQLRNSLNKPSPYAVAAWLSHAFASIRPFEHANGRMSRLLGNLVMFQYGFPFPVPISNNDEYLEALRLADRDYEFGRNTSHLALLYLNSSNSIYRNYLSNLSLYNEFK
ncbi:hypothetical protein ACTFIW_013214 [Dictyostelium discoideum]